MRLICPNCAAEYEVDDEAIPAIGRDVQCSACNHAWYFMPPEPASAAGATLQASAPTAPRPDAGEVVSRPHPLNMPSDDEAAREAGVAPPEPAPNPDDKGETEPAAPATAMPKPPLDENVARVLREEAERETQARRAEASGLEVQSEFNLPPAQAPRPRRISPADTAVKTDPQLGAGPTTGRAPSRKELPDVEEVSSSLQSAPEYSGEGELPPLGSAQDPALRRRSGFRTGFLLIVVIAILLLLVYAYAPSLMEAYPQSETWLQPFVDTVDDWRIAFAEWFESATQSLTDWLNQTSGA